MDLSLVIPQVAAPATTLAEALELAPISKLLYGSDAVGAPELFLLSAVWWRDALADVLPQLCRPMPSNRRLRLFSAVLSPLVNPGVAPIPAATA